ncbi:hypothetical protein [Kribbella sp. NBC_00359]
MGRYAGVIAQYDGRLALVREQYEAWDAAYWNLPGGRCRGRGTTWCG